MKKSILILLFIACQLYTWSQGFDNTITKKGEPVSSGPVSITSSQFYIAAEVKDRWVSSSKEMRTISDHQTCKIKEDIIVLEPDTLILDEKERINIYKTWVSLNSSDILYKGVLYKVNDSSITLSNSFAFIDYVENDFKTMTFQVNNIEMIKTRKKNNALRGLWIGAVSGFGAAIIWGFTSHGGSLSNADAAWTALTYAVPSAAIGAGVGALIGSVVHLRIPIHGNMNKYNSRKKKLKKRSLR